MEERNAQLSNRIVRRIVPVVVATLPLTWIAVSGFSAASASSGSPSRSAVAITKVSDRPDSGNGAGTWWADDYFTRTVKITLTGEVPLSNCGGSTPTGHCYHWTGLVSDIGKFVTIPGIGSPGTGDLNGGTKPLIKVKATGIMAGGIAYNFYSSFKTAAARLVPATENDNGSTAAGVSTGSWVTQFFPKGAKFWNASGKPATYLATTGGWTYTLPYGADTQCPHLSSQWVDSSWPLSNPWGTSPGMGNILAPDAAHC